MGRYIVSLFQELPDSEYIRRGVFFTIGDSYFLATAAVITDSGSVNLPSNIYKWNGNTFEVFQSINGPGISYMYKFDIDTDSYLAVLHTKDVNGNREINSELYKWNGNTFVKHSDIPTKGAVECVSMYIDGDYYLMITNNMDNSGNTDINSEILKWNGNAFNHFQYIPTKAGNGCDFANIYGNNVLCINNHYGTSSNTHTLTLDVYK